MVRSKTLVGARKKMTVSAGTAALLSGALFLCIGVLCGCVFAPRTRQAFIESQLREMKNGQQLDPEQGNTSIRPNPIRKPPPIKWTDPQAMALLKILQPKKGSEPPKHE